MVNVSSGFALAEREVGAEYFKRNSLIPRRTASHVNSASFFSFPGEKKIIWLSSAMSCFSLKDCLIFSIPFSRSEAKKRLLVWT